MVRTVRYTSPLKDISDYIVLDTETTGVNPDTDRIIEIGLVEVNGDVIANKYGSFVYPGRPIPPAASNVNHIYDRDVADAPDYSKIAPILAEWVIGKVVIAHNASFDLKLVKNLLSEAGYSGTIKYIDTLFYSRRVVSGVPNYKLQTLAEHFGINPGNAHRAVDDAITCHYVFQECKCLTGDDSFSQKPVNVSRYDYLQAKDIMPSRPVSPGSPFYDKIVVFTGDLSLPRREAFQMAVDAGAILQDNITLSTDYLVEGVQNPEYVREDGLSAKQRKAAEINQSGKGNIRIIGEEEFKLLCKQSEPESHPESSAVTSEPISSIPQHADQQPMPQKRTTRSVWPIVQWAIAIIALLFAVSIVSSYTASSILLFMIAILAAPLKPLRAALEKLHIKGALIAVIIIILFIVALFV